MNHQAEYLEEELRNARSEIAELRKRLAVPDVSAMARVLSDRSADACNIDRTDNWAIYGQEYIGDVQAMLAAAPAPVERVEQDYDAIALDKARNIMQIMYGEMPKGGSAQLLAMVQECILEAMSHVRTQKPAPTSARKAPPEDPLCGIEYRADVEANFYTLSAATGSWIARIQFNGQFYPHEQERILSAMLGDRKFATETATTTAIGVPVKNPLPRRTWRGWLRRCVLSLECCTTKQRRRLNASRSASQKRLFTPTRAEVRSDEATPV